MNISIEGIDKGNAFDWGKTSKDYAKYRDIYPEKFYENLLACGIGTEGQSVLDIGTGTGVLPRNMYKYGAKWTGTDIAENQIIQAIRLADEAGMDIDFAAIPTEDKVRDWEEEHMKLLMEIAPEKFDIIHYVAMAVLTKK